MPATTEPRAGARARLDPALEPNPPPHLIELGWLLVGRLDPRDREAIGRARRRWLETMRRLFPGFEWRMPVIERPDLPQGAVAGREEPAALLEMGVSEREAGHWDFAFVVTGSDLVSHYKPFALGTPSRSLAVAVLSTARIEPRAAEEEDREERIGVMEQRLYALAFHLFGHLNGLEHRDDPESAMYELRAPRDLDRMGELDPEECRELAEELADVADLRLEEASPASPRRGSLRFYLRAAWHARDDVWSGIRQAEPWLFPVRLSRLTTAAASALLVLLITAEAWDLGMSQRPGFVVSMALVVLAGTTAYVLERQRLLVRRGSGRLTEQRAVTNLSVAATVLLGLSTTYAGLFLLTLAVAFLAFPSRLVADWAVSRQGELALGHYLLLAGFVSSLGLVIGALGATFEAQYYFRHIAYVDEET